MWVGEGRPDLRDRRGVALLVTLVVLGVMVGLSTILLILGWSETVAGESFRSVMEDRLERESRLARGLSSLTPEPLVDLPVIHDPGWSTPVAGLQVQRWHPNLFLAFLAPEGTHLVGRILRIDGRRTTHQEGLHVRGNVGPVAGAEVLSDLTCEAAEEGGGPELIVPDDLLRPPVRFLVNRSGLLPGPALGPGAQCDPSLHDNWGDPDPSAACFWYTPNLVAEGNTAILGGRGHGSLVVRGSLLVQGDFSYRGLLYVRDTLVVTQGVLDLTGVADVGFVTVIPPGRLVARFSPCAIESGLRRYGTVAPVRNRSWLEGAVSDVSH